MVVVRRAEQAHAQERPVLQVERRDGTLLQQAGELRLARLQRGQRRHVIHREMEVARGLDALHGTAVHHGKAGAQRVVAADHLRKGALHRRHVQRRPASAGGTGML